MTDERKLTSGFTVLSRKDDLKILKQRERDMTEEIIELKAELKYKASSKELAFWAIGSIVTIIIAVISLNLTLFFGLAEYFSK